MLGNEGNQSENMMGDFESFVEKSLNALSQGSIVKGTVIQINNNDVLLNIGYKTEGRIPRTEFEKEGALIIGLNDEVDAVVKNISHSGDYISLSAKGLRIDKEFKEIEDKLKNNVPVNVTIREKIDKGFLGNCGEIGAFILEDHMHQRHKIKEHKYYIGKSFKCKVLKTNSDYKNFLASRRLYLEEDDRKKREEFFNKIKEGDLLKGKVKTLKDYGAFINFGYVEGFLYKNNINWGIVKNPAQFIDIDDMLEVVVLNVDKDQQKLEVSLKHKDPDPWFSVDTKYPVGSKVKGTVVTRKRKGYVVVIESGIDGLIPEGEISWFKHSSVKIEKGDVVEGQVLEYDNKDKYIVMSVKLLTENPWENIWKKYKAGSFVKGKVVLVKDFGLFINFGEEIDGLIKKIDIAWDDDGENIIEDFKKGDIVDAKVLKIDVKRERISLGIKQLEPNPWDNIRETFPMNKLVSSEVEKVLADHIEVILPGDIKGIINKEEFGEKRGRPADIYKQGDIIKSLVHKFDFKKKIVYLSVKAYDNDSEMKNVSEYLRQYEDDKSTFNLGSIIKDKLSGGNK